MNYATNFAIVKNGTVTNLLTGLVYNTMDDFPNAVHTENLDVQIGDTYENGVFMRDGQVVTGGNVGVQSDWNQNDNTQPDYVKNRPGGYTAVTKKGVDIQWDGVIGDKEYIDQGGVLLVKVSDDILTSEQLSGAEITQIGTKGVETVTYNHTIDGAKLTHNGGTLAEQGLYNFIVIEEQTTGYSTGTYVMHLVDKDTTLYTSSIYKQDETGILPIPKEYIDDAIQRVGADVIIQSSTPDSTKKFKITVDDSGTISATEVS